MRVLLVEDEPDLRSLLRDILVAQGHVVTACGTAECALAAYGRHAHPLVVLDLNLPGMDGLAFCRRVRALPEGKRTVVLVLTGRTGLGTLEAILEAGADDYLPKPFDLERFSIRCTLAERRAEELAEQERQATERLERERLLRSVFIHARDGMVLVDDQVRFVEANPAALRLLGVGNRTELADRRLPDVLEPGQPAVAAERWQILREEGALAGEYRMQANDAVETVVEYAATARILPGCHLCILHDVTANRRVGAERDRALVDLRASEERLRNLVEAIADGLLVVDADDRIVQVNAAAERILGMAPIGHLFPHPAWTLSGPDGLPLNRSLYPAATLGDVELEATRPDGQRVRLWVTSVPLRGPDGAVIGAVGTLRESPRRDRRS